MCDLFWLVSAVSILSKHQTWNVSLTSDFSMTLFNVLCITLHHRVSCDWQHLLRRDHHQNPQVSAGGRMRLIKCKQQKEEAELDSITVFTYSRECNGCAQITSVFQDSCNIAIHTCFLLGPCNKSSSAWLTDSLHVKKQTNLYEECWSRQKIFEAYLLLKWDTRGQCAACHFTPWINNNLIQCASAEPCHIH